MSEKLESGKTEPAKQSLRINCTLHKTSYGGLKMDSMGIGLNWGFLH